MNSYIPWIAMGVMGFLVCFIWFLAIKSMINLVIKWRDK